MNPLILIKSLDLRSPSLRAKREKLKSRRERRKEQREAARIAKRNGLQQAIAAKNNQRKIG
jgi:hypothetical protein